MWASYRTLVCIALILLTTVLAYLPSMNGARIWDDDSHITLPSLQSLDGLHRIWFDLGATQQYYPLLHSAFWLEHKLWGDSVLGYHLVNVLWHLVAVLLLCAILTRLKIPGAMLAAAIFASHPVMVESVAWISEQKNTLSAVFYLSAMLAYLGFDQWRKLHLYFVAVALFELGLLTKTVTATLPAALLVIFWWQRGALSWKRDVVPLLPFFLLGAFAGLLTAWVEQSLIGAEGADFQMTFVQRGLLAGRVVWFYLSKLLWPANLIFIYPRWQIDPAVWWQWLFPAATAGVLVALWALRRKTRGPLAGWLLFVGTLAPVLGFLNVYPFIFSFVADHFQYLASLGIIVLVAAAIAQQINRLRQPARHVAVALCIVLVAALATLTWRQTHMYADDVALYTTTLARNPTCWMAHNNLGLALYATAGREDSRVDQDTLRITRDNRASGDGTSSNAKHSKQIEESLNHYREAIRLRPNYLQAHTNLGNALLALGRPDEAAKELQAALDLKPNDAIVHNNLSIALTQLGRLDEAAQHIQIALQLAPNYAAAHTNLGSVLAQMGQIPQAIEQFRMAIELDPNEVNAHSDLAILLTRTGKNAEAIAHFEQALRLQPDLPDAHFNLAELLRNTRRLDQAIIHYRAAIQLQPNYVQAYAGLVQALAAVGQFPEAIITAQTAIELARSSHQEATARQIEQWLRQYHPEPRRREGAAGNSGLHPAIQ